MLITQIIHLIRLVWGSSLSSDVVIRAPVFFFKLMTGRFPFIKRRSDDAGPMPNLGGSHWTSCRPNLGSLSSGRAQPIATIRIVRSR